MNITGLRLPTRMYVQRTSIVGTATTKRQFDSDLDSSSSTGDSTTLAEEEDIDMIGV